MNHKQYKKMYFSDRYSVIRKMLNRIPDAMYLKLVYRMQTGKKLNIDAPKEYNEWLQYLKLHYRKPEMSILADKYNVRKWVEERIGSQYLIPLLGVWDDPGKIDVQSLPDSFVLKCTHDSGSIVVCRNKRNFDLPAAIAKLAGRAHINYFYYLREWPYKNIRPRIIAEALLNQDGQPLYDYKFFCFSGEPRFVMTVKDRFLTPHECVFDMDFVPMNVSLGNPSFPPEEIEKPRNFEEMAAIAKVLSEGYPHVRVDLYNTGSKIYFGEITFFHWGGFADIRPEEFNLQLGQWIEKGL